MKELEMLVKAYGSFKSGIQIPMSFFFEGIPDEGLSIEFIEWLKKETIEDQAHFLSLLLDYRPLCVGRLLEISASNDDIQATLVACAALVKTEHHKSAVDRLISEAEYRIMNKADMGFPIGWIIDALYDDAILRGTFQLERLKQLAERFARSEVAKDIQNSIENVTSHQKD